MKTLKYSRQRESIKTSLMNRKDHPTADTLYMSMREQMPNISLGTVYRNLNLLVDLGEIRKLNCGDGADRFDADMDPHYHFICNHCGAVSDLALDSFDEVNEIAQKCCPGKITNHTTYFYGMCHDCLQKN